MLTIGSISELLGREWANSLPISLKELSRVILPVSGTLLGLVYAGLIYWFQGALERLRYTGQLLEDIVSVNGKILLDLFVGASLISLFGLFELVALASLTFWLFAIAVVIDVSRATAEHGYLVTISSAKVIPSNYGSTRQFLRKVRNAGGFHWSRAAIVLLPTVAYPIWVSSSNGLSWRMQPASLSVFLLFALGLGLIRVRSLLLEALDARDMLKERLTNSNEEAARKLEELEVEWDSSKRQIERRILNERLEFLELHQPHKHPDLDELADWQSHDLDQTPVLMGPPAVKSDGSCHLNVYLPMFASAERTREFMFDWTRRIVSELVKSKSEIHYYTVSWFRKELGSDEHFGMMRCTKRDALHAIDDGGTDRDFVKNMSGIYLADGIVE